MQAICAETFRRHRGTEQVAVAEKESTVTFSVDGLAVVDSDKNRVGAQTLGGLSGKPGAGGCIGTFNADQDQARGQPVAQLIHQKFLLERGGKFSILLCSWTQMHHLYLWEHYQT